MRIIGFGHRSRMGKDTAAGFLVGHLRGTTRNKKIIKASFASKLKAMCYDLYGWTGLQEADFYEKEENFKLRDVKLPKIEKTPVQIWIEFGTSVGRSIYFDTWIQYVLNLQADFLVISDVRFINEVEAIQKVGGKVIKIHKPGTPLRDSVADNALENWTGWDASIMNSGSLKDLNTHTIAVYKAFSWT